MKSKQNLLIGGGTVMGAVAAVAIMKMWPSGSEETADTPAETDPKVESTESGNQKEGAAGADGGRSREITDRIAERVAEIDPEEIEGRREEFRNEMRERQIDRLTNKMAKWSAALGLDKEQQEKLLEIADKQFDEMQSMGGGVDGNDPAAVSDTAKRAMAIMSGRALEESMVEMLSPEQEEKYKNFESRQTQNSAEAGALRQLATLQEDLMLTPEQRNDAYGIIYANRLEGLEESSDVSSMIKQFTKQSGVTLDPALQGMISSIANQGLEKMATGDQLNGESIKDFAAEAMAKSVTEQVELLRPVLTEGQLELYRSQLEGRFSNLENMIPRRPKEE